MNFAETIQQLFITNGEMKGQGGMACCSPQGREELDTTEKLNNNGEIPKTLSKSYHFLYDLTSYPMLFLNLLNIFLTYLLGKQNTTKQPHLFRISRRQ